MEPTETVLIREEPIELCRLLKLAGCTDTGGQAKIVITEELVSVNGEIETRKRRKIYAGDIVAFKGRSIKAAIG